MHPVTWIAIGATLAVLTSATANALVSLLALGVVLLLSRARGGRRTAAFAWAMAVGAVGFVIHLVLGALVTSVPDQPDVLTFLPEWDLGQGVSIGGPYTTEQLTVSVERGLDVWVLCALVGLLWQAVPGGRWCDLARAVFGRGSQVLAPAVFLGEALVAAGPRPAALLESNRRLCDRWRVHTRPSRPDWVHAAGSSALLLAVVGVLVWVAMEGGLPVRTSHDRLVVIPARTLLLGLLGVWCVVRVMAARWLVPAPQVLDAVAVLGCTIVGTALVLAGRTGDEGSLATDPGRWPQVPYALTAGLVVASLLWIAAERVSAARVPAERSSTRASAGGAP